MPAVRFLSAMAVLLLVMPGSGMAQLDVGRASVAIATATTSGNYFLSGNAICRALTRHGHVLDSGDYTLIDCGAVATAGSIANVELLRNRSVDVALIQSDWAHYAYRGQKQFAGRPVPQLRLLFKLNAEAFQVVASRNTQVRAWGDLKGKKVNLGPAGSTSNFVFQELLSVHKQTDAWFTQALLLSPAVHVQELCEGNIEAFGQTSGVPNPGVTDALRRCGATLVSLETSEVQSMIANRPFLTSMRIPKGSYPGQADDVMTFAVTANMVATSDLPDSIAYSITMAALESLGDLRTAVPVLSDLTPAGMASGSPVVPWHPGALRAYRAAGVRVIEQAAALTPEPDSKAPVMAAETTKQAVTPQTGTAAFVAPSQKTAIDAALPAVSKVMPAPAAGSNVTAGAPRSPSQKRGAGATVVRGQPTPR